MKPSQLLDLLKITIRAGQPLLITGAPGVGKTDIVSEACESCQSQLIVSHPVVSDPVDFKGMPFVKDGAAEFLPFGDLRALIETKKPTVFFMDDLGQAPPAVQAAAMQLILARRINDHRVSDLVCFIGATNRKGDKAGVAGILEPVKSRFTAIVELEPDVDDWVAWALRKGLPTELIAFIRFRPELLFKPEPSTDIKNSPNPRTVHNTAKLMDLNLPAELEFEAYSGAAGGGFATELLSFLNIYRTLPNPDVVIQDPDNAEVPKPPATLYALCGALIRKAGEQTMDRLVRYSYRLPQEFSVMMISDIIKRSPKLANTRAYIEWASKNKDVLI